MLVRQIADRLLRDADASCRAAGVLFRELAQLFGDETSAADVQRVVDILLREGAQLGAVLVQGEHGWGKGATEKEALRDARRRGCLLFDYSIYRVHPATLVDNLGDLIYPAESPPRLLREVRRRRRPRPANG